MKITLCMVLKNEGKTVRKAIQRALPIIDAAVIGIDKTTSDNTRQEVQAAFKDSPVTPVIYEFKFKNDFAQIRNDGINRAEEGYIFILDGHDILSDQGIMFLSKLKPELDKLDVIDCNIIQRKQVGENWFQQPRLFRKTSISGKPIRYDFAIHNTILHAENRITVPQITIEHDQPFEAYQARKAQRAEINIENLRRLAYDGDPRSCFYLANTYWELGKFKEAINWYGKYLKISDNTTERYQARLFLADCYLRLKEPSQALRVFREADEGGEMRNEHLVGIGDIYFNSGVYDKAMHYYMMASAVRQPVTFLSMEREFYIWVPWYKIVLTYMALNNVDGTLDSLRIGKTRAPELPIWEQLEEKVKSRVILHEKAKNGIIYFVGSSATFLEPIINHLYDNYVVRYEEKFNPEHAQNTDLIWCEWADHNAVAVSNFDTTAKKVLRLHAYEAYQDWMLKFNVAGFDKVIFVADHIRDYLYNRLSGAGATNGQATVIPNWIDFDRFNVAVDNKSRTKKIAWAGYLDNKKAPTMIMLLARQFPEYEFHVAARYNELDVEQYLTIRKPDNLILHPWQLDMVRYFEDKSYVLNTSPRESQNMVLMEGMACGLKPLIWDWVGAENVYPKEFIFTTIDECQAILQGDYNPRKYRKYIKDNYAKQIIAPKITDLIEKLIKEKKNEVTV